MIYEKFSDKNMSGFPSLPVNWIKRDKPQVYFEEESAEQELYESEGGPLHRSL